jgi:hypothetical protein
MKTIGGAISKIVKIKIITTILRYFLLDMIEYGSLPFQLEGKTTLT